MRPASVRRLLLASVLVLTAAAPARAITKLEGTYQLMLDARKNDRPILWDWDSNNGDNYNAVELRIFSQPMAGVESFLKVEAAYRPNDNGGPRPEFQYREGHLRFRREFGKRGFDSYLFSRQDRFFANNYLIRWIDGRGDAEGVRLETWGFGGVNATFVAADRSAEYNPASFPNVPHMPLDSTAAQRVNRTSDSYVLRLRREFLRDNALRLGLTWNRFESWSGADSIAGPAPWSSLLGVDARWRILGADVSVEYGESRDVEAKPDSIRAPKFTLFRRPLGFRPPDRSVLQAEIRSLRTGTERLGYVALTPSYWTRGPKWRNKMGGPGYDERGFALNSYYLLPDRAITWTNNLSWYANKIYSLNRSREMYTELYVEFVNGFTGKSAYKRRDSFTTLYGYEKRETALDWLNELQVESNLAWLRVQTKVRDIGRPQRKELFVVESRLKLSPRASVYNRFAFGNDPSIVRQAIFSQLRWAPAGNMEMFVQYGPDWIGGGSSPVDEGNLNGSGEQKDILKFILKGNF